MPVGRTLWNQRVVVTDGTEIAVDVILPPGDGPFPTVVTRTPYMRSRHLNSRSWLRLVDKGYAYVVVDVRGRGDSDGEWRPFVHDAADAHDVIEWIAQQAWCSGKVGMVGSSYEGLTQWWTAKGRPAGLACIVPMAVGAAKPGPRWSMDSGIPIQYWSWWTYLVLGRTQQHPSAPSWEDAFRHLPLRTLDERLGTTRSAWQQYVEGKVDYLSDDFALSDDDFATLDVPALVAVGWWDDHNTLVTWEALQHAKSSARSRLLIGPWDHAGNAAPRPVLGGLDVSGGVMDTLAYVERFLALHLKGEDDGVGAAPRCRVWRTGAGCWEDLAEWPAPDAAPTSFYLSSGGDARSLHGDGKLTRVPLGVGDAPSDTYIFAPGDPGRDLTNMDLFAWSDPPLDHRYLQRRPDTLVYTSPVLQEPVRVSGRATLDVWVSCDRPDTDLFVAVCDVEPDGRAIVLSGASGLRLRYRNGPGPELLSPGEVVRADVPGPWLHHTFLPGRRIRLVVRSANFPFCARNLGSGAHWADETQPLPATVTVHHSATHPSALVLPVQGHAKDAS